MPIIPHRRGGADVPVTDGGTGASDAASGLTNLGGIDNTAHSAINHAGIPGVGDLTTAAHSSLDHSSIPGAGGYGAMLWFATDAIGGGIQLAPYGHALSASHAVRAPKAGTITTAAFNGDTNSVDFLIAGFNTGFVSNGAIVSPNVAVSAGQIITVQINTVGSGSYAAWTLLIE